MKAYRFNFDGEALGGEAIVLAKSKEIAEQTLRDELAKSYPCGLKTLRFMDVSKVNRSEPTIVHFWNGDY